jgi:hypothetical protein
MSLNCSSRIAAGWAGLRGDFDLLDDTELDTQRRMDAAFQEGRFQKRPFGLKEVVRRHTLFADMGSVAGVRVDSWHGVEAATVENRESRESLSVSGH